MGLIKDLETHSGVTIGYHRITEVRIDVDPMNIFITLASYLDKESRDAGKSPVKETRYHYSITEDNKDAALQMAYAFVKYANGDYTDAKDDL